MFRKIKNFFSSETELRYWILSISGTVTIVASVLAITVLASGCISDVSQPPEPTDLYEPTVVLVTPGVLMGEPYPIETPIVTPDETPVSDLPVVQLIELPTLKPGANQILIIWNAEYRQAKILCGANIDCVIGEGE